MFKKFLLGMGAVVLSASFLGVPSATAGEGCCAMKKGRMKAQAKDGLACPMDAKTLKECGLTDQRTSKTDKELFVCPEMDYGSDQAGKCPSCDKKLVKKYCPMKEAGKGQAKDKSQGI
jgi:hypothetical protein